MGPILDMPMVGSGGQDSAGKSRNVAVMLQWSKFATVVKVCFRIGLARHRGLNHKDFGKVEES